MRVNGVPMRLLCAIYAPFMRLSCAIFAVSRIQPRAPIRVLNIMPGHHVGLLVALSVLPTLKQALGPLKQLQRGGSEGAIGGLVLGLHDDFRGLLKASATGHGSSIRPKGDRWGRSLLWGSRGCEGQRYCFNLGVELPGRRIAICRVRPRSSRAACSTYA